MSIMDVRSRTLCLSAKQFTVTVHLPTFHSCVTVILVSRDNSSRVVFEKFSLELRSFWSYVIAGVTSD